MKDKSGTIFFFAASCLFLLVLIGFATTKSDSKRVRDVKVRFLDQGGCYFTDNMEILDLLNNKSTDYIFTLSFGQIDLKDLEARVESHPFIKDAQVYHDITGNLVVNVEQAKPIARIFPDRYIDDEGYLLPISAKHTARVPIVEIERKFSWKQNITELEYGKKVLALLKYIEADEFWKAQIAHLVINKKGEIALIPQVSKQKVYFGMPEDIKSKFKKLKIFYSRILPNKGWNTYASVNLKFKNQIVCE